MKKIVCLLSAIAAFSLTKYVLVSLEAESQWWVLPVLAIATGLITVILYELSNKFRIANSLLAMGVHLLFNMTLLPLFRGYEFWVMFLTFLSISVFTELAVNKKLHLGDLFLNPTIAALSAFVIQKINIHLLTPVVLIISYVMIICINISFKKNGNIDTLEEDDEPVNNNKIDISI